MTWKPYVTWKIWTEYSVSSSIVTSFQNAWFIIPTIEKYFCIQSLCCTCCGTFLFFLFPSLRNGKCLLLLGPQHCPIQTGSYKTGFRLNTVQFMFLNEFLNTDLWSYFRKEFRVCFVFLVKSSQGLRLTFQSYFFMLYTATTLPLFITSLNI